MPATTGCHMQVGIGSRGRLRRGCILLQRQTWQWWLLRRHGAPPPVPSLSSSCYAAPPSIPRFGWLLHIMV